MVASVGDSKMISFKGLLERSKRRRREKRILLGLSAPHGARTISIVSEVLAEFDIELLLSKYRPGLGYAVTITTYNDPLGLLKGVIELREAIESKSYLTNKSLSLHTETFEEWYGHHGSTINTRLWLPSLCKEVATLAKVMRGAEVCNAELNGYHIRKGNYVFTDLIALTKALLALETHHGGSH